MIRTGLLLLAFAAAAYANEDELNEDLVRDIRHYTGRRDAEKHGWLYDRFETHEKGWLEIRGGWWYPKFKGPITISGKSVDLPQQLGLDNRKTAGTWEIGFGQAEFEFFSSGYFVRFKSDKVLPEELELGEETFGIGEVIRTEIAFQNLKFVAAFQVVRLENFTMSIAAGLGLLAFEGKVGPPQDPVASFDAILPLPLFGVRFRGKLFPSRRVIWEVSIMGLEVDLSVFGAATYDVNGAVGYRFTKYFSVLVGYRYSDVGAKIHGVRLEFSLDGFYVEAMLRF